MHFCLLTSSRIFETSYGGEGRFTISLGNWLFAQGHEVTLMGSGFANVKSKRLSNREQIHIQANSKKVKRLYPPYLVYSISRLVMVLLWVMRILIIYGKCPISLIHSQDSGYAGLAAIIASRILRIPIVISSHGIRHRSLDSIIEGKLKNFLLRIEYNLDIFTIKKADLVIVPNTMIKQYYEELTSRKIFFLPIPIRTKEFEFSKENREAVRKEMNLDKETIALGYIGRFSQEKNLLTLLQAFGNVAQKYPSIKLIMVGTGQLERELNEFVDMSGIRDRVIFCGVRYDIGRLLSSLDIFILPSFTEGLSTALLEAMAADRAIICSDIPANTEIVNHNREAFIIDPHNPEQLENAIKLLSKNEPLREQLGMNAKKRVQLYDEDMLFPRFERLYRTLLSND